MLPTLVGAAVPESRGMLIAVVTFSGILIVFGILLLLIMVFYAYGWIFQAVSARSERQKAAKAAAKAAAESEQTAQPAEFAASVVPSEAADAQPTASDEVPPEIVAAIAAAVYATYGGGYAVRRVRRAPEGRRSAWGSSGVYENTRPF